MPQPIRRICHFEISGLIYRPEHARVLGDIVGISGRLESALGWLLALLSRGSAPIAIAMFHAVASTDAQRSMLLAAAQKSLGSTELEAFNEIMSDFRPRYTERSKLVHNLWGHSDDHPDKALWLKSSDAATLVATLSGETDPSHVGITEEDSLCLKCMAYTVKDMQDVASRLNEYTTRVNDFIDELMKNHPVLVAAATAATNAEQMTSEPQMNLPNPNQTAD